MCAGRGEQSVSDKGGGGNFEERSRKGWVNCADRGWGRVRERVERLHRERIIRSWTPRESDFSTERERGAVLFEKKRTKNDGETDVIGWQTRVCRYLNINSGKSNRLVPTPTHQKLAGVSGSSKGGGGAVHPGAASSAPFELFVGRWDLSC